MAQDAVLDGLARRARSPTRARPPSMALPDETPTALRTEQVGRRESRLGLRSLFGRRGASKDSDVALTVEKTTRAQPRSTGIRASLADMSNWSYGQQPVRADIKDPATYISRPLSTTVEHPTIEDMQSRAQARPRASKPMVKPQPGTSIASWDAPPLFKAYPQAIKHATLPTSILPPDAIIRMREKKMNEAGAVADLATDSELLNDADREKAKKKKTRAVANVEIVSEWTTKIYILVTSGCLLQYSSEGSFDRLPEKVLQLGRASAAFASDVFPGRHWVLQVSSALEADGTACSDTRSLFSRLPFRVAERRQASNFFMVFESAKDMDGWMATLRREIESLGGKKNLSETGKPKTDESVVLRERTSQRTLVVRDPDRYSRSLSIDSAWQSANDQLDDETTMDGDTTRDQSLDETSATNSFVSHDGRQLENLRDSAHRLSAISSGQRTALTSTGSSPSSSPTRDSFFSNCDDERLSSEASQSVELRPRPNAAAIVHRRRSLQAASPFMERTGSLGPARPPSTLMSPPIPEGGVLPSVTPATPNFSVPQSSSRRFSYVKAVPEVTTALTPPPRSAKRRSPPALNLSRPLSMVADQPSPQSDVAERPATRHGDGRGREGSLGELDRDQRPKAAPFKAGPPRELATRRSSFLPQGSSSTFEADPQPRRFSSMTALRKGDGSHPQYRLSVNQGLSSTENLDISLRNNDIFGKSKRSLSPTPPKYLSQRASLMSVITEQPTRRDRRSDIYPGATSLPSPLPPPDIPLPPLPKSSAHKKSVQTSRLSQRVLSRRSLSSLVEGPPPAPPPSCALPPIPQKQAIQI